jgi:class 3 adenylate cyclase
MKTCNLLVFIVDISNFAKACRDKSEHEIFSILDKFYTLVETEIEKFGGKVIKFMGDSALITFELDKAEDAKEAIKDLTVKSNDLWQEFSIDSKLKIKSDICNLICGEMGLHKNFDVVGNDLNQLFMKDWD